MTQRAPVHVGRGEPVLLLHPFLMSQNVWKNVTPRLADRFEVFAPTLAGHNGGPRARTMLLDAAKLADHVEAQMDALGWGSAHVVGNSLGGWVAFELERRGRARTVTAIAPAGGWTRYSPGKFETIVKFLSGAPVWVLLHIVGSLILRLPLVRELAFPAISGSPTGLSEDALFDIVDNAAHCPAYYQLPIQTLVQPGLLELAATRAPVHLVLCERDRVFPRHRFAPYFTDNLPAATLVTTLAGVGHIPMFEAPDRVAELIIDFIDDHAAAARSAG
jgi:pimeloyl-ACP methyl ester carboxylesterase